MVISRRGFLKFSFATVLGFLSGGITNKAKSLFAATDTIDSLEKTYKVGDKVSKAGRYQCIVCGLIVEYLPKHIEKGVTFSICTLCQAGTEKGHKKPNEEFWKYIGNNCKE